MQQSVELKNAIDAVRQIKTQADLSVLADIWRQQQTFIGNMAKSGLKKGDTIEWEYRGMVRPDHSKDEPKTVEVADAGASPFGRTITKIQNSMITRKVA